MKKPLFQLNSLTTLNPVSVTVADAAVMVAKVVLADGWKKQMASSGLRLRIIFSLLLWIGVFIVQSAQANGLSGSDDPALQAAIEVWLEDNDKDSLPVIATLASKGNIAARLLLAQIENTDRAPSDFVSGLSRKERVDLFRSTTGTGLFRPSWLKSEKLAGNQIASALLKASALEVNIEAIQTLYEIGEPEATYDLIRQVAANGSQKEKQELAEFLPETSELAPYLRALQTPVAGFTPGHAALQQIMGGGEAKQPKDILPVSEQEMNAATIFVEFGYQTGVHTIDFDQTNHYYDDLVNWIETASETAPIATLCHRICRNGIIQSCDITAFGLVGGYYKAIRYDSPIETLIKQSRYTSSDRAVGMVLRRISTIKTSAGNPLIRDSDLRDKSGCLANAVAEVRAQGN